MPSPPIPLTDEENALFQPAARRLFSLVSDHAIDVVFDAALDPAEGSNLGTATANKCREAYDRCIALVLSAQAQLLTLRLVIERGLLTDSPLYPWLRYAGDAPVRH